MLTDAERPWKIQGRLDDQEIGDRSEPHHDVRRIVVTAQPNDRVEQRQYGTPDHGQLQDRQRPVLEQERVAQHGDATRGVTREAQPHRQIGESLCAKIRHRQTPAPVVLPAVYHCVTSYPASYRANHSSASAGSFSCAGLWPGI
ncbi:Uncharacterised protein [Mycobacteroides abscessus subsp. abscessus]|nr:Uncharacterised protein [Mycobacteroides abscessus subsp. abscessus]